MQFVDDGDVAEVERDIDVFFQGHCSDHMLALAVRKYAVEYLDGLKLPSVQAGCDKSVRSSQAWGLCTAEGRIHSCVLCT